MTARRRKPAAAPTAEVGELEDLIEHTFRDRSLLERALVHGSAATEGSIESNQTLEFLGDAVLDLAVSEFLLRHHPGRTEGELTRMRAAIVNANGLAAAARRLGLGRWIRLGRGEARSGGEEKANILADTYEAIVAALFLDAGYERARDFIEHTFAEDLAAADPVGGDWKTELQEITQRLYHSTPGYVLVSATGPDHAKHFEVAIRIAGTQVARGDGATRKGAEQMAARAAVAALRTAEQADSSDNDVRGDANEDDPSPEAPRPTPAATGDETSPRIPATGCDETGEPT